MKRLSIFIFLLAASSQLYAQDPFPNTDIYVAGITKNEKGKYNLGNPTRLTSWSGYDNQPWFLPDGTGLLFSSIRESGKADIYKYIFAENKAVQIINTPLTAEFSPMIMPDKIGLSCVRVMEDDSTQLLYKFVGPEDNPFPILAKQNGVGYYLWLSPAKVALFVLGEPETLQIANLTTGEVKTIASNVGRCIQKMPGKGEGFSYVDKSNSEIWNIKSWDPKSGESKTIIKCLPESEDYCWLADGTLLMGSGSILYKFNSAEDEKWEEIADFEDTPLAQFYRLASNVKGDKIAIVTYSGERP